MPSHLGQNVHHHVVLELGGGINGGYGPEAHDWIRRMPDASEDTTTNTGPGGQFRVPKGSLLVVTDVDWQYANQSTVGVMQVFRLFVAPVADTDGGDRVFESAVVLGPDRSGGACVAMTAGFAVSHKARIGLDVSPGPMASGGGLQHAILRGYLIRQRSQ